MRAFARIGVSLALFLSLGQLQAQETSWRPVLQRPIPIENPPPVTLGRPEPLVANPPAPVGSDSGIVLTGLRFDPPEILVRAQDPGPPPPPPSPFGGPPPAPAAGPLPGGVDPAEAYRCGVVNNNASQGGFWSKCCDKFKSGCNDVFGSTGNMFKGSASHKPFQSDHAFEVFSSPVSNPFYFEDPRALTEVRPIFIWQHTPGSNYIFAGGNNYFAGLQGRVALTENISLVVNKLGWVWMGPDNPSGVPNFESSSGFGELHLGPKFTFLRNDTSNTVAAVGLTFELPVGSNQVYQSTGNLSLVPYFSIAQNFLRSSYGSFNFMNTTAYALSVDSQRTDYFLSSFHLDYNVMNLNRFFPMVELNWAHYTFNGSATSLGFEGYNMFNFGSDGTAGHDELTLALGGRVKINDFWQVGLAAEFSLLGGGRHLDDFRLTMDMIFRY